MRVHSASQTSVSSFEDDTPQCGVSSFAEAYNLTRRQRSILSLLVEGHAPKHIAGSLNIAHVTVRRHLEGIYVKSGTQNQRELLALFARTLMTIDRADRAPASLLELGNQAMCANTQIEHFET